MDDEGGGGDDPCIPGMTSQSELVSPQAWCEVDVLKEESNEEESSLFAVVKSSVYVMLDSGSVISCVPAYFGQELGLQVEQLPAGVISTYTAVNGSVMTAVGVVHMTLRFGSVAYKVPALVVDLDRSQMAPYILLGMPFFRQYNLNFNSTFNFNSDD
jgi:hypothetical protein